MFFGCGTTYYGSRNFEHDGVEETFDATKWFCMTWIPLIPLGSFHVCRRHRPDIISRIARGFMSETVLVQARPLDVPQITKTYLMASPGIVYLLVIYYLIFSGRL